MKKYYISTTILLQSYFSFPVLNRKTFFYFFKKSFHISCVYYLLSQRFFYLMTVKLPKKRNNLLEEMNPKWDCIVSRNTCFQQIFIATEKKSKEIFFYCKRIWKTQEKIKFRFIQEPWICWLAKSGNPQIFHVINIMNFSKFAQEI